MTSSAPLASTQPAKHLVTFFDDKFARVKYEDTLSLEDLAAEIRDMHDDSKSKLPWLKLARFGDQLSRNNCLRTNANLQEIHGVEIDYDAGEITLDVAACLLLAARVECILYTSASHTPERPRWRVLAPTSKPTVPAMRAELVASINGIFAGAIADESFVLSTAFYYGYVGSGEHHRVEVLHGGRFIDQCDDLWADRIYKQPKGDAKKASILHPPSPGHATPGYDEADIRGMLEQCRRQLPDGSGQWHSIMLSVSASLVMKGWSDKRIYDLAAPYCDAGWGDGDLEQLIKGARAKYQRPDPDSQPDMADTIGPIVAAAAAATGQAIPETEPNWRERYVSGFPKASLHNARLAIEHSKIRCSEDTFHHRLWIGRSDAARPNEAKPSWLGEMTDSSLLALRFWLSDRYGFDLTEKHVREAAVELARENRFDPVADMLDEAAASWDGKERLDRMAVDHFNCADTPLNRQIVRKTMIAAVARVRNPGCKHDTILVMESAEGMNKSSAWLVLAGEGNFSDQSIIGAADREVQEQLAGIWIHESADLAGMSKREVEAVKAFASRQVDRARPAYGRLLVEQPRRSIEVATTNSKAYLLSTTGNRRFWPIVVERTIDLRKLRAERLQLWGEAARCYAEGETSTLDPALWAAAGVEQEERRLRHPWEDKLATLRGARSAVPGLGEIGDGIVHIVGDEERVASAVLFEHVLKIPLGQMHNGHAKTLAEVMRALGWKNAVFKVDGKAVKGYTRTLIQ
jgi:predicted P-loop ATPase